MTIQNNTATTTTQDTIASPRFSFGKNWQNFLDTLDDAKIKEASLSLINFFGKDNLNGLSFLDIGSGSGIFSLAARNLGAMVHSFDYDMQSVECAKFLKNKYYNNDQQWQIEQGSILDKQYLSPLITKQFDIVYSWGVLHHTGAMYQAFANTIDLVKDSGLLFISIYNDQGNASKRWTWIKKTYNNSNQFMKTLLLGYTLVRQWGITFLKDTLRGNPLQTWRQYGSNRGMSAYYDLVDWAGGYPFEVATPEDVFSFFYSKGFQLQRLKTCAGGLGCNEFLFQKIPNTTNK